MTPPAFVRLHADDNIAVAARSVPLGSPITLPGLSDLFAREAIDMGHKIAIKSKNLDVKTN